MQKDTLQEKPLKKNLFFKLSFIGLAFQLLGILAIIVKIISESLSLLLAIFWFIITPFTLLASFIFLIISFFRDNLRRWEKILRIILLCLYLSILIFLIFYIINLPSPIWT